MGYAFQNISEIDTKVSHSNTHVIMRCPYYSRYLKKSVKHLKISKT